MGAVNYEKKIKSPTFTNTEKFIWNLNHDFSFFSTSSSSSCYS
ncbi:hypothetical protein RIR_e5319_A0A2N0PS21_9GLOM [Rhizophagus irregularis DAOM 181602=DAOM 197198]|nr:hypothetical protein RIR_e5319_A0A2N0PS21_9GLOM [Rhizophagus irregularis DAOM 181602=DAOM 197198]